ncbi:MAG: HlyD family secretion protein [Chthoniobacterales bacterium]
MSDDSSPENSEPEDDAPKEKSEPEKKPKRPSKKVFIIGGIILLILIVGGILYYLHARNYASTDDAYTTAHVHPISARVAGTVQSLNIRDNEHIHAGQVLLKLDPSDFEIALQKARAQLLQAQASVTQRQAAADRAGADLKKAESDYKRTTDLYQQDLKAVSKSEVDAVTAARATAQAGLASAKADLAVAAAGVANAEATGHDAELQLSYTTVVAPVDGLIGKRTVETGQRVQPGQALMAVVEENVWVLANYKETQLARVRVGQHATVKVDAVPDHVFSAHVDSLQPGTGSAFALLPPDNATGNFTKIVQRVPVKIVFDHLDGFEKRVVPGLSAEPEIDLRSKTDDAHDSATR